MQTASEAKSVRANGLHARR